MLDPADAAEMVKNLWVLGLIIHPIDQNLAGSIIDIAYRYELTVYDAAFVSLAQKLQATFVTADRSLYEKAKGISGIVLLSSITE